MARYPFGMYNVCMTDAQPPESTGLHRVTVNLIQLAWDAANETAAQKGLTRTDVINRALQVYAYFERRIADGDEVLIRSRDGELTRERFL
jgi:hypothetical protein